MLKIPVCVSVALLCSTLLSQAESSLTIYNQNFACVRERLLLDLRVGTNDISFTDISARVEPDSVILRDTKNNTALQVLEQNYRADPVSIGLLLSLNEGKELEFVVPGSEGKAERIVKGKVIRSGYHSKYGTYNRQYASDFYDEQQAPNQGMGPIIEVDGKLQFVLPGQPRFPSLADDTVLKPTLVWKLHSKQEAKLDAELAYVTGGMSWEAAYNVITPVQGETLDLTGWVTMDNQCGKSFTDVKVQLIAGDVAKTQPQRRSMGATFAAMSEGADTPSPGSVSSVTFDEYHLYTLPLSTTLHDRETKQVEFVRAAGVTAERSYVYDGLKIDRNRWGRNDMAQIRDNSEYGTESTPNVWVLREFKNTKANQLGIPLPRGKVRFYRMDQDGQLQFTGENVISHTPSDETIRIYTGNAFDIVGERKRTNFVRDRSNRGVDETFEIRLRNHKKDVVEVRIVEHLYRWTNWEIRDASNTFLKNDAQTIDFRIPLKPEEERVVTYTAHYSW